MNSALPFDLGATYLGDDRCAFCVWAPLVDQVDLHILSPAERTITLQSDDSGYHFAVVKDVGPGARYLYRLDGGDERPDPVSRFQPEGVHRPSEVVDPAFTWEDRSWCGLPLRDYIIYEAHVGAYTPGGTFDAMIAHIDELRDLGITALELMPVAQFPGGRNWGYDGVHPFAVQNTYGGPMGLKRLVNACHKFGLAVVLDVVYNHLGPEGNCLGQFGPYFTNRYHTPWGDAVNFDGPDSDEVRRFFIGNALYWIRGFHIDALRVDAVHAIFDFSAIPFLEELGLAVHQEAERLNRRLYVIPESDLNDTRIIRSRVLGGFGLDAQWSDDFHHALHTLLTGERTGYYQDFGAFDQMVKAVEEGFVYSGQYSPYRRCRHGNSSQAIPPDRFVVFSQNHDQVGNRMLGERLHEMVSFEQYKLAAATVILSPFIPLLFMGEEYGETAPFAYFTSHLDEDLAEAVRKGRHEGFSAFDWQQEPPDPQDEGVFRRAVLNHGLKKQGRHGLLLEYYRELIRLRKQIPALARLSKDHMEVSGLTEQKVLWLRRWSEEGQTVTVFHFGHTPAELKFPPAPGHWKKRMDSADLRWKGPGTSVPLEIAFDAEANVILPPWSCLLWESVVTPPVPLLV